MQTKSILDLPDASCNCEKCQKLCEGGGSPCIGTPAEIRTIMNAGYTKYLLPYDQFDIGMVQPATRHRVNGFRAHGVLDIYDYGCAFKTKDGCMLHTVGMKPIEGRKALACDYAEFKNLLPILKNIADETNNEYEAYTRYAIVKLWDSDEGRQIEEDWWNTDAGKKKLEENYGDRRYW